MTWLDELVTMHTEMESPSSFWYWSGLCAISAVVKDNVWLDRGAFNTYPNIYVMLHAASGLKKGPPVGLAKRLVRRVNNTKIISGRSSIQGILKELGSGTTRPDGKVISKSNGFIVSSEFSSSLVSDPSAMTILTDLYDRQYNEGEWHSLLKMESFDLIDPTISLLVATNQAHFDDFIEAKDIHGGFIGRMFVIAEDKVHRLNPLIRKMNVTPDLNHLSNYLREISKLKGPFKSLEDTPAGDRYEEWYNAFYTQVESQKVADPTGTIQRFGDSVLKVAMLLSLSARTDLTITIDEMDEAIAKCERLIGNVRKTTFSKNGSNTNIAAIKAMVITELLDREPHEITRTMLNKKYMIHATSSEELDAIMTQFEVAGSIKTESRGHHMYYVMPDKIVEEYKRYLGGQN